MTKTATSPCASDYAIPPAPPLLKAGFAHFGGISGSPFILVAGSASFVRSPSREGVDDPSIAWFVAFSLIPVGIVHMVWLHRNYHELFDDRFALAAAQRQVSETSDGSPAEHR